MIVLAKKPITFAASDFDTTSELTLQIVGGVQQNQHTMKQTSNNVNNTLNKKANRNQLHKRKKAEANARRKINKSWKTIENTPRYRSASAKEVCAAITKKIEIEVLDGGFLNLRIKSQGKSTNVQNRLLRRIVEKRQAQANHKKYGRTVDLTLTYVSIISTSRCMETIRKKRFAI